MASTDPSFDPILLTLPSLTPSLALEVPYSRSGDPIHVLIRRHRNYRSFLLDSLSIVSSYRQMGRYISQIYGPRNSSMSSHNK